jgi:hypothetical protein
MFRRHTIEKNDIVRVSVITPKIHNQYNITNYKVTTISQHKINQIKVPFYGHT